MFRNPDKARAQRLPSAFGTQRGAIAQAHETPTTK